MPGVILISAVIFHSNNSASRLIEPYLEKDPTAFFSPEESQTGRQEPEYLLGDINDDGEVSVEDAQLALLEYVNAMTGLESSLTDRQKLAADVNGDKESSVEDAQTILLYYVSNTLSGENVTWDDLLGKKPQGQQLPFLVKIKDFFGEEA